MTNTEMREFLEKEFPEARDHGELDYVGNICEALDKAVEDVRKLKEALQVIEVMAVDSKDYQYISDHVDFMCEQTSWAEVK